MEEILDLVLSKFGMQLPETHLSDVASFVKKRMKERKEGLLEYIDTLSGNRVEYINFVDAITINESYFFRDSRHFFVIGNEILPRLFQERQHVKIWSAASAAGEEALSLSALCNRLLRKHPGKEYTIYASDINVSALNKLREGRYTNSAFREDGSEFHSYLLPYMSEHENIFRADNTIRERIVILEHNLFQDDYAALPNDFDLVMLRNVFIYMPMENRHNILRKVAPKIRTDGYLFLSASEVPLIWHPTLKIEELSGTYFFRRCVREASRFEYVMKKSNEKQIGILSNAGKNVSTMGKKVGRINTGHLYERVNHFLYNPLFKKNESKLDKLAGFFVSLVTAVNAGDINTGVGILDTIENELGLNEVILHYRARLAKLGGETDKSVAFLRKALQERNTFWPARYELAMLLKDTDTVDAKRNFSLCGKHIREYLDKGKYSYHFLLDGFNALYFLKICAFWEQKLGGSVHGSG